MRYTLIAVLLALSPAVFAQQAPSSLWQSKEEGFVVRIESCGAGFCGYAAGGPSGKEKDPKKDCGKQTWHEFVWNERAKRWEGTVSPPNIDKSLKAFITTDGRSSLAMTAKVMFMTKTMNFKRFTGSVTESCEIKQ